MSLLGKLTKFARTPQGQKVINEASRRAQEIAKDPATRAKIEKARRHLGRRG
jgi:hypothetical protein